MDRKTKTTTMERMVMCAVMQEDIGTLLDVFTVIEKITLLAGPPPEHIRQGLDDQIHVLNQIIFKDAAQA